jgi:hypothetical protein
VSKTENAKDEKGFWLCAEQEDRRWQEGDRMILP